MPSVSLPSTSGETPKYLQRIRTTFTPEQVETLTLSFDQNPYPSSNLKKELASQMNINPIAVQVWFKNKRAKCKRVKFDIQKVQMHPKSLQVQEQQQKSPQGLQQQQKSPQGLEQQPKSPQIQRQQLLQHQHQQLLPVPLQLFQPQHQQSPQLQHYQSPQLQHEQSTQVQQQHSPQLQYQQSPHTGVNASPSQSEKNIQPGSLTSISPVAQIYTNHEIPSFQLSLYSDLKNCEYPSVGHKMVHFGCCQDPAIYWLQPILKSPNQHFGTPFPHFAPPTQRKKRLRRLMTNH
ncbi:divergent paired-related homeobox [Mastomys coucha]|uniref:divergent paired-related homeobox n=1 Tax=Mastomys coucha TaxID=35658 RepID=UPI001261CB28|nr:divergent paired-related homeobox [Mastomys coucha]